ncbi:MAG: ABC transporter ATP-binding protein/permease, partial [Alphaproteobacteria bacterium]|nr:ABC transporter ATP-binding protein/permease [Alphaproteobacteria bacterium]
MNRALPILKDAWRLAKPYFRSDEKWSAWLLLISIIVLNLLMVGLDVVFNFWNRAFFNAVQVKDWHAFMQLLLTYRGSMPGFVAIAFTYIIIGVYAIYLNQWLQIRWRNWMTGRFLEEWLADRAYYRISLTTSPAGTGTDNPDQRIAEDLRDFTNTTLALGIEFMSNIVELASFIGILWALSGAFVFFGFRIPGYMVWVALLYAIAGTWVTHLVGRPLALLRFMQQRFEADFRFALVRFRENVEGVALYGGEREEQTGMQRRFQAVIKNWRDLMNRLKLLNALVYGYRQLTVIFPYVVAAPRYFSGAIPLGGLTQTANAFGQVQSAMSWFVNNYAALAAWSA